MRLELNSEGKYVLRGVNTCAWAYIKAERERCGSPEHFCFGRENFGGTVYITVTPYEDKTEIVHILNKFVFQFGLTTDDATERVLKAWREDAEQAYENMRTNEEKRAAELFITQLKRIMRDGCKDCTYFRTERCGDDINGYCTAIGKTELHASALNFKDGMYLKGVQYMGMKFYPCENCLYLKCKEEVA